MLSSCKPEKNELGGMHPPLFRIHSLKREEILKSVEALKTQLEKIRIQKKSAEVKILYGKEKWPGKSINPSYLSGNCKS